MKHSPSGPDFVVDLLWAVMCGGLVAMLVRSAVVWLLEQPPP